jgi:dimethylargininase
MVVGLTRAISPALGQCELTHVERVAIDLERARAQHWAYERALEGLGVEVRQLSAGAAMADSVFIEDTAVVVEEVAVITRPGAESRRGETAAVAAALAAYRPVARVEAPGTVDGGDVLVAGKRVFVGRSSRTNEEGIRQLGRILGERGYRVEGVEVRGCLHLKSAATEVGEGLLLVNEAWIPPTAFAGLERVAVDPSEAYGANALRVGDGVLYPAHFPRTRERLARRGVRTVAVACDELAKAEGALTCCSLLFSVKGLVG